MIGLETEFVLAPKTFLSFYNFQFLSYFMFYFIGLLILASTSMVIFTDLNPIQSKNFCKIQLFAFIFLLGLPPFPLFFLKLALLFCLSKAVYFSQFIFFLFVLLLLWVYSGIYIWTKYSHLTLHSNLSQTHFLTHMCFILSFCLLFFSCDYLILFALIMP